MVDTVWALLYGTLSGSRKGGSSRVSLTFTTPAYLLLNIPSHFHTSGEKLISYLRFFYDYILYLHMLLDIVFWIFKNLAPNFHAWTGTIESLIVNSNDYKFLTTIKMSSKRRKGNSFIIIVYCNMVTTFVITF